MADEICAAVCRSLSSQLSSSRSAGAEMDKCVAAIQAKIKMMQDLAPPPAAAQKPEGR